MMIMVRGVSALILTMLMASSVSSENSTSENTERENTARNNPSALSFNSFSRSKFQWDQPRTKSKGSSSSSSSSSSIFTWKRSSSDSLCPSCEDAFPPLTGKSRFRPTSSSSSSSSDSSSSSSSSDTPQLRRMGGNSLSKIEKFYSTHYPEICMWNEYMEEGSRCLNLKETYVTRNDNDACDCFWKIHERCDCQYVLALDKFFGDDIECLMDSEEYRHCICGCRAK
uniref:Uncharacterized protein n=1 Tax=Helicotheca tamesis TaxID=374047 RepID=A0A7S2HK22_9STRA|mmetsp:Transcript_18538/g.25503  ORF Transcript_18538/g.25503 Transcript_18538/m.25503 type:complete len:226 (+) Transcript_18538:61-738(+)